MVALAFSPPATLRRHRRRAIKTRARSPRTSLRVRCACVWIGAMCICAYRLQPSVHRRSVFSQLLMVLPRAWPPQRVARALTARVASRAPPRRSWLRMSSRIDALLNFGYACARENVASARRLVLGVHRARACADARDRNRHLFHPPRKVAAFTFMSCTAAAKRARSHMLSLPPRAAASHAPHPLIVHGHMV